ncbi:MAG: aspartate--tRNA ligase, partial [Gammaproteobacteria bacterium]|nr:aspartate--tRNA ligase [Gammaproteobacteria bacterium]
MLQRVFTHQIPSIPLQSMITCSGWLSTIRDHGGIVFFQFRDRFGTLQCVYDPAEFHDIDVHDLKPETVVSVQGILLERPDGTKQPTDKLGHLELHVKKVTIHSKATALPFQVSESHKINEELRLQYRYIDLRHPERAHPFFVRSEVNHLIREFLRKHDFIECETPILTKPTPEGARAYIVPSRIHLHNFYALAQSPQLYKQLMMAAGFERYYQIARCFRDEDLRADRQPEFTQLDIEMSFIDERMIQDLIEQLVRQIFTTVLNVNLPTFKRMTYDEAMKRYGSDKPDLRCPLY